MSVVRLVVPLRLYNEGEPEPYFLGVCGIQEILGINFGLAEQDTTGTFRITIFNTHTNDSNRGHGACSPEWLSYAWRGLPDCYLLVDPADEEIFAHILREAGHDVEFLHYENELSTSREM